jgi:ATP-dependent DNA helicase RecG
MQTEMRRAGLSPASFESDREGDSFTATFLFHHFLEAEDITWLARFQSLELSHDMLKALVFVRERGRINNATYRDLVQCHPADATRDLRRLSELGLLLPEGNTTSRVYRRGPALAAVGGMPDKLDIMHDKGSAMHDKGVAMHGKGGAITDSGMPALPEELRTLITLLGRRTEPEILHGVVEKLCAWLPLSIGQLAELLGRTETYTRVVVGTMVKEGKLERTRPDTPRHPEQAYRTARKPPTLP